MLSLGYHTFQTTDSIDLCIATGAAIFGVLRDTQGFASPCPVLFSKLCTESDLNEFLFGLSLVSIRPELSRPETEVCDPLRALSVLV